MFVLNIYIHTQTHVGFRHCKQCVSVPKHSKIMFSLNILRLYSIRDCVLARWIHGFLIKLKSLGKIAEIEI